MYTLTSDSTGKVYLDTKQGRAQLDRDEGRERLTNDALEALIIIDACQQLQKQAVNRLASFQAKVGRGKMLKAHVAGIGKEICDMMEKVSCGQVKTMQANTHRVSITVSSARVPCKVNIDMDHLVAIANQAVETCGLGCTKTPKEMQQCAVRRALEQVPSMAIKTGRSAECPYADVWPE
ncbi:MAG: hypothetical protein IJ438_00995 [Clostridia bacterium]|nr:hypothetical protein [Clostridia bacterium]MBQ8554424.1 hypothetical protein [Clostridia bacterium]